MSKPTLISYGKMLEKLQCCRNRVLRSLETNVYFLFFHLRNIIITVFQHLHRKQREALHHLTKVKNSEAPRFFSSSVFFCPKIPPNHLYSFTRWIAAMKLKDVCSLEEKFWPT